MTSRALALLVVLAGCPKSGEKGKPIDPAKRDDAASRLLPEPDAGPITLAPAPPLPALPKGLFELKANPRVTPEAVAFGELLFYDGRLSTSGGRACANCHDPTTGYAGAVQRAADEKSNLRRTPTLVNLAWSPSFGWDGRYKTFAAHLPPHLKGQLGDPLDTVAARIAEVPAYKLHIARVGGSAQDAIVQALEAFVLTRYEGDAPWDRMERTALTKPGSTSVDPIVAGYQLFIGKAQCGVCHTPPAYTDQGFHRVAPSPVADAGHGAVDPAAKGKFKTPTLRGAALRPSLFHAGTATSLEAAIASYQHPPADADPEVKKIKLSADEVKQLLAFLNALTSDRAPPTKPIVP
jgi:cytochrome c peroxidase